jgi:hypothetical protein
MNTFRIKDQLRRAFGGESQRISPLSHDECLQLRRKLISLDAASLQITLPQVLIDLVDTHTSDYRDPQDVEEVVRFLDANPPTELDSLRHPESPKVEIDVVALSREKAALFEVFSSEQINAISSWLQLAKHWPEMQLRPEDMRSAVEYWERLQGRVNRS